MKPWRFSFIISMVIYTLSSACSHDAASAPSETPEVAAVNCSAISQAICTREFVPTVCSFHEQKFSATNPCEARKLVKDFACKNEISYTDDKVSCEGKPALAVKNDCEGAAERKSCTREYKPSLCRFGDLEAKGSNRCEAPNTLRTAACAKKLAYVAEEAVCESETARADSKKPRGL